jgi:hypothetical protein
MRRATSYQLLDQIEVLVRERGAAAVLEVLAAVVGEQASIDRDRDGMLFAEKIAELGLAAEKRGL